MYWDRDFDQDENLRMQTDIRRLPDEKQRELERITEIVRAQGEVEMVILFGSYARGDWCEEKDLKPGRWSGHVSDYDILVVVREPERAGDVSYQRILLEATNAPKFSTHVHPIVHDIEDVNANLEEGRYFFMDIKREGALLYDSEAFSLSEPRELTAEERQRMAQGDFYYWFDIAKRFYRLHELAYGEGDLRSAIFSLNQVTESAYKAILMVFTSYCPHEHLLEWLGQEAAEFGPVFREIFPTDTQKARERFELLDRAYIGARYRKDFVVFRGDVEYLAPRVKTLLETTESVCCKAIARMVNSVKQYRCSEFTGMATARYAHQITSNSTTPPLQDVAFRGTEQNGISSRHTLFSTDTIPFNSDRSPNPIARTMFLFKLHLDRIASIRHIMQTSSYAHLQ